MEAHFILEASGSNGGGYRLEATLRLSALDWLWGLFI